MKHQKESILNFMRACHVRDNTYVLYCNNTYETKHTKYIFCTLHNQVIQSEQLRFRFH